MDPWLGSLIAGGVIKAGSALYNYLEQKGYFGTPNKPGQGNDLTGRAGGVLQQSNYSPEVTKALEGQIMEALQRKPQFGQAQGMSPIAQQRQAEFYGDVVPKLAFQYGGGGGPLIGALGNAGRGLQRDLAALDYEQGNVADQLGNSRLNTLLGSGSQSSTYFHPTEGILDEFGNAAIAGGLDAYAQQNLINQIEQAVQKQKDSGADDSSIDYNSILKSAIGGALMNRQRGSFGRQQNSQPAAQALSNRPMTSAMGQASAPLQNLLGSSPYRSSQPASALGQALGSGRSPLAISQLQNAQRISGLLSSAGRNRLGGSPI